MLKPSSPLACAAGSLPQQPFFALAPQRVRLARERYFDQGQRPTGLVAEPVIQSWARCLGAHLRPHDAVAFDPVSRSRVQATLARNRHLLLAAGEELQHLEAAVGGTGCRVLLTDADGVVVHATAGGGSACELLPTVSRVGINLAEAAVGTNAPAVVLKTGQACAVSGAEHFYDSVQRLHCAAAPIRDTLGGVAGVLDLTVEARPFGFDAAALVGIVATAIENRLLQQGTQDHLVLQFQVAHSLLGSPLQALVGVSGSGHLAWANGTAQQLLGLSLMPHERPAAEDLFGQRMNRLLALVGQDEAQACRLPNGLTVWMRALGPGSAAGRRAVTVPAAPLAPPTPATSSTSTTSAALPDVQRPTAQTLATTGSGDDRAAAEVVRPASAEGPAAHAQAGTTSAADATAQATAATAAPAAVHVDTAAETAADTAASTPAPTLVDHQRELIAKVLDDCAGNISQAARRLGVSRGLLYRRRRDALAQQDGGAAARDNSAEALARPHAHTSADPEEAP